MQGDREAPPAPGVEHAETTDAAEQMRELREALAAGREVPAGRLLGLPELEDGDVWVDIAGAAAVAHTEQRTITSWLSRQGPKRNPFPPAHRFLYRLYWPLSAIEAWRQAEDLAGGVPGYTARWVHVAGAAERTWSATAGGSAS